MPIDILQPKEPLKTENNKNISHNTFSNLMSREFSIGNPFSEKLKETFYLEMQSLVIAGLDIKTILQLLLEEQSKTNVKSIISNIQKNVILGSSLSDAMKSNKYFSKYEYITIAIGEASGKLPDVLLDLAAYYKKRIVQRRLIISALTYPSIVFSVAIGAIFFMMKFVVPMFADVFKRFGGHLPTLTLQVLRISQFISAHTSQLILTLLTFSVIFWKIHKKEAFRKNLSALLIRTPFLGKFILKSYTMRFASTMALLTSAHLPLLNALELTEQVIGFYPMEKALKSIRQDIIKGKNLHESLAHFKIFPPKMVMLVKVGEETNRLEFYFKFLSDSFSDDMEYATTQLGKFIEPAIILILGLLVGVVLVSMYLPLFNLGNSIH